METTSEAILSIEHPRQFEGLAGHVLCKVPGCVVERTRDTIHIFCEGETGASLLFTPEEFEVRLPSLEWVDNHIPAPTTRIVERYKYNDTQTLQRAVESGFMYLPEFMIDLLHKAAELRKAEFKECKYCKGVFPPERRYSENVCHGCARTQLGIVY